MRVFESQLHRMRGSGGYSINSINANAMRGGGIGSVFSSLYRAVVPFIQKITSNPLVRNIASDVKSSALKAGLDVVNSALRGEDPREAVKSNVRGLAGDVVGAFGKRSAEHIKARKAKKQKGRGPGRPKKKKPVGRPKKKKAAKKKASKKKPKKPKSKKKCKPKKKKNTKKKNTKTVKRKKKTKKPKAGRKKNSTSIAAMLYK